MEIHYESFFKKRRYFEWWNIVCFNVLIHIYRDSWKRLRETMTILKIARKTQRLTSIQSRYVLVSLEQKRGHFLAWITIIFFFFQDYELQILTYKALQDPITSPLKKPKMECASDDIIQEVGFITHHLRRAKTCIRPAFMLWLSLSVCYYCDKTHLKMP